jgi:hypothetical protein
MEVLKTTAISDKQAAKLLKTFVESKEEDENTDLMVRRPVVLQWQCDAMALKGLELTVAVCCCCADERGGQVPVGAGAGALGRQEAADPASAGRVRVRPVLGFRYVIHNARVDDRGTGRGVEFGARAPCRSSSIGVAHLCRVGSAGAGQALRRWVPRAVVCAGDYR